MAARDIFRLLATAAIAPAVVGSEGCLSSETCAQDIGDDETALIQTKGASAWKKWTPKSKEPVGEVKPEEEFDAAEGGEDEEEEEDIDASHDILGITGFVKYFEYSGPLQVTGKMWMRQVNHRQDITYKLLGVDPACEKGRGTAHNSCGINLLQGTSCDEDSKGHHYDDGLLEHDPWQTISYTSLTSSTGVVYAGGLRVPVLTGLKRSGVKGHALVVHDFAGARIACTIINGYFSGHPPSTNTLPSLKVTWSRSSYVSGEAKVVDKPGATVSDTGIYLSTQLEGVDPACANGPGSTPNSCSLSITSDRSCRASLATDLYNADARAVNPWIDVSYASFETNGVWNGHVEHVPVNTGLGLHEIQGYTFVVRSYEGTAIACGVIG